MLQGLIDATQMIPQRGKPCPLWEAIQYAVQRRTDSYLPAAGEIIEAGRILGRHHDKQRAVMVDPYWYRSWKSGHYVAPFPDEPHAPAGTAKQIASSRPAMSRYESEQRARLDIEAHARHLREELVPETCVRCVLEMHADHREPVADCFRCQMFRIGVAA